METQPGLLTAVMREKSEEQAAAFSEFRRRIEKALADGRLTARHGPGHWRAVETLAARLVPERVLQGLPAAEVRTLATVAVAHDICAPGQRPGQFVCAEPSRYGLSGPFAAAVAQVCDVICCDVPQLEPGLRWVYLERGPVDLRRVAAVLLLADRLDLEHTDAPPPEAEDLAPEQATRWPVERGLSIGLIDPREGVLRLDLTSTNREWRREIEEGFMPSIESAALAVRNVLLRSAMPFREVELHDLHARPSTDLALAQDAMRARQGARRRPVRPFKLLDPFGEDEPHLLVARDDETVRLAGRVLTSPITVLVGETGVGKTSLVQAGLLNWLRDHEYDGVYARCLNDPTQSLLRAASERLGEDDHPHTLDAAVKRMAERSETPVVLVLDQCQELFTRLGSRTREEFARDLAGLLSLEGDPVHVLLVIQRSFFPRLVELLPQLPTLLNEVFELKRLTREQAESVIRRATGRFRVFFDGLVVSHLIDDLATSDGILPVELQICCDVLYNNLEEGERKLGYEVYRRVGPARRVLDNLLEQRLRNLRWRRQSLAKSVLVNMVTAQRTKALVTPEECAVDIGADLETTQQLLDELSEQELLRQIRVETGPAYELRHEYLAQRLEAWISDVEREAKDVDDLLHRELNNYEKFQLLLDREKLRLIHHYRRRLTFTPEELDLVIRSAARERLDVEYWFSRVNELLISQQVVLCVDLLYSPEPDLREALRHMISRLDHKAVLPTLLASLNEADAPVRETAIEVLREIDQNLVRALEQGDVATQQQAAYALGQIGARHAVEALVETAQYGAEPVREQAVEALVEIDRVRSAELLIRSLRSGNHVSRWNAAVALGRLGRDAQVRERLRREAQRREAEASVHFAYARACIEGRQFEEAERVLSDLERRAIPQDQTARLATAWEDLRGLQEREERGLLSWPMYRGNPGGTAYTPIRLRLPLELKWEFATNDVIYSSPAVANGVVYVGSDDRHLYAVDADSGNERWECATDGVLRNTPCVVNGTVYVASQDGHVHAVHARTGRVRWTRAFGSGVAGSLRGDSQRLLVATADGSLVAFGPSDGREQWRAPLSAPATESPAMGADLVVAGTADGTLVALAAATGEQQWSWRVDGELRGSPVVTADRIVVGTGDGRVEVLDTQGVLLWSGFLDGPAGSSPAVGHERIYLGTTDGVLHAFELATGRSVWRFDTQGELSASPTLAGGVLFVGSQAGQLFALRARTGEPLWRYRTGYAIYSTPAVADGRLFVALRYNNICAFSEPMEVEDVTR